MLKSLTFTLVLVVALMNQSAASAALDDSIVLYLAFDEGEGDEAIDGSLHGNNGELVNNPEWVDGKVGGALEFNGAQGQHVIVPVTDALQLTETFSVAFWVKRGNAQPATWNYMVAAGTLKWAVIFNQNDGLTYVWSRSGGTWAQKDVSDDGQPQDWTHIVMTHDTGSGVTLYYDGQIAGKGAKPPVVDAIDGSIMVGARHPGQEFFTGTIDEVFLFNRIITADEMQAIMEDSFLSVEPGGKLPTTWAIVKQGRR